MGLSNEERYSKFFWSAMGFRRNLAKLAFKVGDERVDWETDERCDAVVRGWVQTMDHMVGTLHLKTAGGGSSYWLLGENEKSLRGILSDASTLRGRLADPWNLNVDAHPETYVVMSEPEYETVGWWSREADHQMTADRLQCHPYESHRGLNELAMFWDAYSYLSAISYPLNRYDDDCFPRSIHEAFTRLCGEMINRRFEVCFGAGEDDQRFKIEQYLLVKHDAFHSLLEDEMKKRQGDDYLKKEFDGRALYKQVAEMTAKDLSDHFEKKQKEKWDWDRKYHADEAAKKEKTPKQSGLFGPKPPAEPEEPEAPSEPPKGDAP